MTIRRSTIYTQNAPSRSSRTPPASRPRSAMRTKPPRMVTSPVVLDASMTVRTALLKVLCASFQHIQSNLKFAHQDPCPEAVHKLRVGVRRMRGVVFVFRKVMEDKGQPLLRDELRWFELQLASAREWDVSIEQLGAPVLKDTRSYAGIERLTQLVNTHRLSAHEDVRSALNSPRLQDLLRQLALWIGLLNTSERHRSSAGLWFPSGWNKKQRLLARPVIGLAAKALQAQHRRASKLGYKILKLDDLELHKLRIKLKELRYITELFFSLWHKKKDMGIANSYLTDLKNLQAVLGSAHDATVTVNLISSIQADAGTASEYAGDKIIERIGELHRDDRKKLNKLWKQFSKIEKFWKNK